MKINFTGRNIELTDALKNVTEKKMDRLSKYFQNEIEGDVTFSSERNRKIIEVTINLPEGTLLRAEESSDDMYVSIDKAVDILERQMRKHKTRLQNRYRNSEDTIRFENVEPLDENKEEGPKIVKNKRFFLKPMTEEEAVLQMDLLGHNFFVFMSGETGNVNVVYKRKDGNYGLIEPEF